MTSDHEDDTFDSMIDDNITPIGILKKKKSDSHEDEATKSKKFCDERIALQLKYDGHLERRSFGDSNEQSVSWHDENMMKHVILNNVNLCVENLSKLLNETCPDAHQARTSSSDMISMRNNNRQRSTVEQLQLIEVSVERTKDAVVVTEGERCHVYAAS